MRHIVTACVLVATLLTALPAAAQNAAQGAVPPSPPVLSEQPVEGTAIRRVQDEIVVAAPFERVAELALDYARYPEFLRRFRSARVVRRDRARTDVYIQLELPRAMGVVWFVHRMTVVRRDRNRLEIEGVALSGNAGRVETRVVVERLPAQRNARFTFALFGVPAVPALPDTVNDSLRDAVRAAATLLQDRAEQQVASTQR